MVATAAPYAVSLDPERARQLAAGGAALLLLDVPQGTLLGVDRAVFVVGPRFKGLKMVPPGVHFLSYQAAGRGGQVSPAVSTFLALGPRQVVVRRWDPALEGLAPLADEDEEARYAEGVRRFDFDAGLAPYDLAGCGAWGELSCCIDEPLLRRLMPAGGEISVMAEALDPDLMEPRTEAERRLVQQLQERSGPQQPGGAAMEADGPGAQAGGGGDGAASTSGAADGAAPAQAAAAAAAARWGRCRYTRLPRLVTVPGARGAELTALNLDKTAALEAAAADSGDPGGKALLGELQFAYIAFLYGQSLEGVGQWKALMGLFLGCERGPLASHTGLFVAFLGAAAAQLAAGLGSGERRQAQQQWQRRRGDGEEGSGSGSDDEDGGDGGGGPTPLGLPLVEELLPDSFLRRQFGAFFGMLEDSGGDVPPPLAQKALALEALLRDRLGWDYRITQLGGGGGGSDEGGDEDQPVLVELSEAEQRLAGLLT
ncbi:MAG: AAR2-domain-containing protein [Monoraphidium minutum]|nr:MAG: AAR2-domain-containing protein [Monoraphidium minutum]